MRIGRHLGGGLCRLYQSAQSQCTCYGISVNLAARQMTAGWGIWLDAETAVCKRLRYRAAPIASRVSMRTSLSSSCMAVASRWRRPPPARDDWRGETAQLRAAAVLLAGRCGGMVIVVGAGIGKSRLLYGAGSSHARCARAHTVVPLPRTKSLRRSLSPFRHLLHNYFRQRTERNLSIAPS